MSLWRKLLALLFGAPAAVAGAAWQDAQAQEGRSGGRVIFEQPSLAGVPGNFHVPLAEHGPRPQRFLMVLWQPNPNRPDGQLVPSSWTAGEKTGFRTQGSQNQYSFKDEPGASTVQIEGDTVGAYLNSRDLPESANSGKMMITPAFRTPPGQPIYPFREPGMGLRTSFELQIPTATDAGRPGSQTYAGADFMFEQKSAHAKLGFAAIVFRHEANPSALPSQEMLERQEVAKNDADTHAFRVVNRLAPGSHILTVLPDSAYFQSTPWVGYKKFDFVITHENFVAALKAMAERNPNFPGSQDPADYSLTGWHLNAELTHNSAPAEMGWSMRRARVELSPAGA